MASYAANTLDMSYPASGGFEFLRQHMVGLIDDDPVRTAGTLTKLQKRRHESNEEIRPIGKSDATGQRSI